MNLVKKIILPLIIIIFIIAAGAGVYLFLKNKKPVPSGQNLNIANTNINAVTLPDLVYEPTPDDRAKCLKTSDEVNCLKVGAYKWSSDLMKSIIKEKDSEKCQLLSFEDLIDQCLAKIAIDTGDVSVCEKMANGEKCKLNTVIAKDSWQECKDNLNGLQLTECFKNIISARISFSEAKNYCDQVPAGDKIICLDLYYSLYAQSIIDRNLCQKISTKSGVEECLKTLPPDTDNDGLVDSYEKTYYYTDPLKADTDADGLNDYDEVIKYKTDPTNKDTDGDGYLDSVEVKAGYDPLKRQTQ